MSAAEAMEHLERIRRQIVDGWRANQPALLLPRTREGLHELEQFVSAIDRALDSLRRDGRP